MSNGRAQSGKRSRSAGAYIKQAAKLEGRGLFEEAINELQAATRVATDKAPIYKQLAELYRSQRQMDNAINAIKNAIKLKSDDVQAREMFLEMLVQLSRLDEAIRESKALLQISPRSLSAREMLSNAYLQKGMIEKALQVTDELINLDPASSANHFRKGWLYQQKGDVGNAIHEFSRVLEMEAETELAEDAQQAIETLDSQQLRHIVMLAVEDYVFRAKLMRDPESAALERGYYLSYSGMSALKQIQFEELPEVYSEWKQRYYH